MHVNDLWLHFSGWMIFGCIFLENCVLNMKPMHACHCASKIKFVWQCVIHQDIRKKHLCTCEVEVAICCLWCILYFNTNLPLFLLVYCVSACMWMICGCIFLEKILNIFIHASPSASKIKFVWHCVIHQDIRKKHANNLRDLLWNLWAVSSLVNLPKKAKIRAGRQECKTLHILWQGRG